MVILASPRSVTGNSAKRVSDCRQWLDNHRRLRALVAELETLTLTIAHTRQTTT